MAKKNLNKNNKKIIERHKKKIILVTIISMLAVLSLLGTTFAMFIVSKSSSKQDMYKTGDLSITFSENTSSKISLSGQYPMTDEAGLKTTPYTFTITNTGNYNISYNVKITNTNTNLSTSYIKYSINNSNPALLSSATKGLDIGTLIPGETRIFNLRLWIDKSTTESQVNKTYSGKITVSGQATRIPYFVDKSGANAPILASGMIPVVYDGVNETWMVADQSKGWYSYQNQIWANAITTSDSTLRSAEAGTPIPMSSINSMWVWIPRYKYQIPSNIGSSSNVTSPPEIDVVFESGTATTGLYTEIEEYGYYTHPAFQNGTTNKTSTDYDRGGWSKELSGIWVGKFETGGSATTPLIKPDIQSLRSQNVSTQFQTSLKFAGGTMNTSTGTVTFAGNSTYGLTSTTDTHMAKNTEWGAVAYLSQSKYGKYGNENYTGSQKEIYINNSSSYYTGRSGGNVAGSTPINGTYTNQTSTTGYNSYGFYTYDDYLLSYGTNTKSSKITGKGVGASTTGTIYGIYDMSGGANDDTMSNWNSTLGSSGFSSFPSSKYYDKYTTGTNSSTITKEKAIKGDATYETMSWYSDYASFVSSSAPWSCHGGSYINSNGGVFNVGTYYSDAPSNYSMRSVLIP